jgi:hypothetical protein
MLSFTVCLTGHRPVRSRSGRYLKALAAMFVAATTTLTCVVGSAAEPAYLNAKDAGPDFEVQGEYAGPDDAGKKWGLQVIALGEHKFDGVLYAVG